MMRFGACAIALILAATALSSCSDAFGNKLSGFDEDGLQDEESDILSGEVRLEDAQDSSYVQVRLEELGISMLTDGDGVFRLPRDLPEGKWTIKASYPYFQSVTQEFRIENGVPADPLKTMTLKRALAQTLTTNGEFFVYGDVVVATLGVENVSTEPYTIRSDSSPAQAIAVLKGGELVYGGLVPGLTGEGEEWTFNPGDAVFVELRWRIEGDAFIPGDYQVYAALTADETYPEYFDAVDSEFNLSLYAKLTAEDIRID